MLISRQCVLHSLKSDKRNAFFHYQAAELYFSAHGLPITCTLGGYTLLTEIYAMSRYRLNGIVAGVTVTVPPAVSGDTRGCVASLV